MKKSSVILLIVIFAVVSSVLLVIVGSSEAEQASILGGDSRTELYAGSGGIGLANDSQTSATFRSPQGIVGLPDGSVVVADTNNHLLRLISEEKVSTFSGIDFLPLGDNGLPDGVLIDGELDLAAFNEPVGLATDEAGNIYIADSGNHAIRKVDVDKGEVVILAGNGLTGTDDATGQGASFYHPMAVVVSDEGEVYVADTLNHLIRVINPEGEVSTLNAASERVVDAGEVVFAGDFQDGALGNAFFNEPSGLVLDDEGNLYVSDTGNQLIRYIDLEKGTVSTVAGFVHDDGLYPDDQLYAIGSFEDGSADQAAFNFPRGLALTDEGGLVIADSLNHAIRYLHDGQVITISGSETGEFGNQDGENGSNLLHMPTDVTVMPDGSILIVDAYNNQIKRFTHAESSH